RLLLLYAGGRAKARSADNTARRLLLRRRRGGEDLLHLALQFSLDLLGAHIFDACGLQHLAELRTTAARAAATLTAAHAATHATAGTTRHLRAALAGAALSAAAIALLLLAHRFLDFLRRLEACRVVGKAQHVCRAISCDLHVRGHARQQL